MRHLRTSIDISAPTQRVWPLIADFANWPTWGPSVRTVSSDAATVAAGVRGTIQTPMRLTVRFEITAVVPGRSWTWRVAGIPATGHHLEATAPGRSRLTFTVHPLLAPYLLVLRIGLRRVKRQAETG